MGTPINPGRRRFLKATAIASGGLALGFYIPGRARLQANETGKPSEFAPNAFIRIAPDDTVTVVVNKSEMGQGVYTALPMLVAEELEADWQHIRVESAPAHPDYNHTQWGTQVTGGSSSVNSSWEQLRTAGATAREMLIGAAAASWGVDPATCRAENGQVLHPSSGRRLSFGALAAKAGEMPVPEAVLLKDRDEFKIIGTPVKRLDTPEKTRGQGTFGLDVRLPGMLTAVIARPPVFGATLIGLKADAAKAVTGVEQVVSIPGGVAVVARDFWSAKKGRDALVIDWDLGPNAGLSSDQLHKRYAEESNRAGLVARKTGDTDTALGRAETVVEASYELPYLAHAPMEPLNCVADVRANRCEIWTGTQMQTVDQQAAASIAGLAPEQVHIHTTLLGGGFGRRANPASDFVAEAVAVSKAVGKPVRVVWTREDEVRGGYYRPMHYSRLKAALDEKGNPVAWTHRLVGESIVKGTAFEGLIKDGIDQTSVEGAADMPYAIPNQLVSYSPMDNGIPVLWWRSVGHTFTAFVVESFLDELAAAGGKDPLALRLELLKGHPRHRAVLELAAEKAGWGRKLPKGRGLGLAVHESFGSFAAEVAEVSVNDGRITVERVVVAIDCGFAINPDIVEAQMESGVVFGLSAVLYGRITLENGRVQQSNFHDYPILRINEMPKVEVHIVDSGEALGGIGEPGVPPIAPAVTNAIYAATGKRIRRLPIRAEDLSA